MGFFAEGMLIGYQCHRKENLNKKTQQYDITYKHFYHVLIYDTRHPNKLYNRCDLVTVISQTQCLPVLKPQIVIVGMELSDYNIKSHMRYTTIKSKYLK